MAAPRHMAKAAATAAEAKREKGTEMAKRDEIMTAEFWAAAAVRAVRTACQTAVAIIGTNAVGVTDVDWLGVASGAALAAVVSVLTAVATDLPEAG